MVGGMDPGPLVEVCRSVFKRTRPATVGIGVVGNHRCWHCSHTTDLSPGPSASSGSSLGDKSAGLPAMKLSTAPCFAPKELIVEAICESRFKL